MWENFIAQIRMTEFSNRGNQKAVGISILVGAVLIVIGVYLPTNIFMFGGIKSACLKYKEEMGAHSNANPGISGSYNGFDDFTSRSTEWIKKGDPINKRLFDAIGITYYGEKERTLEQSKSNFAGLIKAAKKCSKEGVDFLE